MFTIVQIDWSARWKVVLWSSWLRWRSRVDLEEKCRLGPVREWLQPGIGHGRRSIIVCVASRGLVSCEEGLASKHHWETVMMRDGRMFSGRMSSGESLISLLRSSVRVSGQMANARAQVGLFEKSWICVSCWNAGDVCWCRVRFVVPRKKLGQLLQQRDHPIELRVVLGRSVKISECKCCVCDWIDWKPSSVLGTNGWPLLCMVQVDT